VRVDLRAAHHQRLDQHAHYGQHDRGERPGRATVDVSAAGRSGRKPVIEMRCYG
jgi:hypothetical protein